MNIAKPLQYLFKQFIKSLTKKTAIVGLSVLAVVVSALAYQNLATSPDLAKAASTPEACFATTGTTEKTITNYYWHENNNPANPACPRSVVIPSTIGGGTVTAIGPNHSFSNPSGAESFAHKSLTQVVLPGTVTTIGDYAFAYNFLTTVTIPESVTSIGMSAFRENSLATVYIKGNPNFDRGSTFALNGLDRTTVPAGLDGWTNTFEYYQNHSFLVHVYSDNPSFISKGKRHVITFSTGGSRYTYSGFVVNPVSLTVNYQDTNEAVLRPQISSISSDSNIVDYKITNFTSALNNPNWVSSKLDSLYQLSSHTILTPPLVSGYLTPNPHTLTFTQTTSTHTFTYQQPLTTVPFFDNKKADSGELIGGVSPPADTHHPIITQSSLSLDPAGDCQTINQASLLSPASLPEQDKGGIVPDDLTILGGLDFTLDHCQVGGSTGVDYTLGQNIDNPEANLKVYKHNPTASNPNDKLQDITDFVTFSTTNGKTILSYELIDGGELDQDGTADGKIVDPIYVGMLTNVLNSADAIPSVRSTTSSGGLADTGDNLKAISLLAILVITVGSAALLHGANSRKHSK